MALSRADKQRKAALAKSIKVRRARSDLREACRSGKVDPYKLIEGALEEHEDTIAQWRIEHLMKCVPGIGPATAVEIYIAGQFSPRQQVSALSLERRAHLAELCREGSLRPPKP